MAMCQYCGASYWMTITMHLMKGNSMYCKLTGLHGIKCTEKMSLVTIILVELAGVE